jgi:Atypical PilZ domain, cyclic di-GMP receptor
MPCNMQCAHTMNDLLEAAPPPGFMGPAAADAQLFSETLAVDEWMPLEFASGRISPLLRRRAEDRSERLLASLSLLEDRRSEVDGANADPALQRLDAKLNLLLDMLGEMLQASLNPPSQQPFRWSRNGIRVVGALDSSAAGVSGMLRMLLSPRLPQMIEIPATVIALGQDGNGQGCQWFAFDILNESLHVALDRHLIRAHRRALADTRR